jgi:hypothetical protein
MISASYNWDGILTDLILLFLGGYCIFAVFMYVLSQARDKTLFKVLLGMCCVPVVISIFIFVYLVWLYFR